MSTTKQEHPAAKDRPSRPRPVRISVNNKPVELPTAETTGGQIKKAAGIPSDFKLYDEKGEEISDDERIKIHNKQRFTAISGQDVS